MSPSLSSKDHPNAIANGKSEHDENDANPKLKVTVLSGFLGAGKTTLLQHILQSNNTNNNTQQRPLRMAVIVNDMGELNLDAQLIQHSDLIQQDAEMVELHNGCICCTLRGDLLTTVQRLSLERDAHGKPKFDYLVIESTGIGEPLPVAQTFTMDVDNDDEDDENENHNENHNENEEENEWEENGDEPQSKKPKLESSEGMDNNDDDDKNNTPKQSLSHYATLDTLVTVVDALNIYQVLGSVETLADGNNASGMIGNTGVAEGEGENDHENNENHSKEPPPTEKDNNNNNNEQGDEDNGEMEADYCPINNNDNGEEDEIDDRPISKLWLDQIEFANVIVVSKAPLFVKQHGDAKLQEITTLLQKLNPGAQIVTPRQAKFADLNVETHLVNTGLFDMEKAEASASWQAELAQDHHTPETEEYGISSLKFECDTMPFHPQRLCDILTGFGDYETALMNDSNRRNQNNNDNENDNDNIFGGVVRSKGHVWLANAHSFPLAFQTAGAHVNIDGTDQPFLAAIDRKEWDDDMRQAYQEMKGEWTPRFGDRKSQLVFIGIQLDKPRIRAALTQALLTPEESEQLGGVAGWRKLSDPFFQGNAADEYFELPPPQGAPLMLEPEPDTKSR